MPVTVSVLVLARAVNRLGAFTLPFLGVFLVTSLGATVREAGYLLGCFGLATIPSRLLGGRLADRLGGKATILLGLVGTSAAMLLLAGTDDLASAAVSVVLLGLVFEVYEPPSQSIIADVTPPEQRPAAYGLLAAAMAVAGMAAGLLAAVLAGFDLRWLFVVDAATCLLCAAVVAVLLPATARPRAGASPAVSAWADRRLLVMLACGTAFAVVYLQLIVVLPLTVADRGLEPWVVGALLTVSAVTMVAGQPLLPSMDDQRAMTLGYVLLAAGLLATGLVTSTTGFVAATVLWSLGDLVLLGRAYTVVAGLAPEHARGRYLAVYGTSWGVAGVAAPLLGTQLLAAGGPALVWSVLAAIALALAAVQPAVAREMTNAPDLVSRVRGVAGGGGGI